jgi:hypothetical protein
MEASSMKNKLIDLNDHLFEQLERLNNEDLKGDQLKDEIRRSQAVSGVARNIISTADLALKAEKLMSEGVIERPPKMLRIVKK